MYTVAYSTHRVFERPLPDQSIAFPNNADCSELRISRSLARIYTGLTKRCYVGTVGKRKLYLRMAALNEGLCRQKLRKNQNKFC